MSTQLAAATRRRAEQTRERARAALRLLDRDGAPITYVAIAKAAGVSRALLYRDPELRDAINKLRDRTPPGTPRRPVAQRMSQASRDELLASLRDEVKTLRQENHALRQRLATVLGEERAHTTMPVPNTSATCL